MNNFHIKKGEDSNRQDKSDCDYPDPSDDQNDNNDSDQDYNDQNDENDYYENVRPYANKQALGEFY